MLIALPAFQVEAGTERVFRHPANLHQYVCTTPTDQTSAWHARNIYDCKTKALFIPYQLWTGAPWDGDKTTPCMHSADTQFSVNGKSGTTIKGPLYWTNQATGEKDEAYWSRDKIDRSKIQFFTCHDKGIGRVYDSRGPRYYPPGRCKFPAGSGWELAKKRDCVSTSIEILNINFDEVGNLSGLQFKWWYGDTLDHIYLYVPEKGMVKASKQ